MYQIRMYHTCRCIINSTAVSLFVYSLVGGGTHDTYVPPKKHLYRYLFIRQWVVVRMIPTFRPWTHTSDDSYIYQLSLVVATATVSFHHCLDGGIESSSLEEPQKRQELYPSLGPQHAPYTFFNPAVQPLALFFECTFRFNQGRPAFEVGVRTSSCSEEPWIFQFARLSS